MFCVNRIEHLLLFISWQGRTRAPRARRPSILDEEASLSNTEKLKNEMKESTLGCKLLQQMESFRGDILSRDKSSPESEVSFVWTWIKGQVDFSWCFRKKINYPSVQGKIKRTSSLMYEGYLNCPSLFLLRVKQSTTGLRRMNRCDKVRNYKNLYFSMQ